MKHVTFFLIAVSAESPLLRDGQLVVALDFPYPSANNSSPWAGDWNRLGAHTSELVSRAGQDRADIRRTADAATYHVRLAWSKGCAFDKWPESTHKKLVVVSARYGNGDSWVEVTKKVAAVAPDNGLALTPSLEKWKDIVHATAEYMTDFPTADSNGIRHLQPIMPPSEQGVTRDTVFDLAYWRWGLDQAQRWRERLDLAREPRWEEVRRHLAPLPVVDGVFVHSAEWHDTYTKRAWEHPDPVGVLGMLPPMQGVDGETAHRTVLKVWQTWDWQRCWGWDFPWMEIRKATRIVRLTLPSMIACLGTTVVRAGDIEQPPVAQPVPSKIEIADGPFQPTWESLKQYECPNWFQDAKLGIWRIGGRRPFPCMATGTPAPCTSRASLTTSTMWQPAFSHCLPQPLDRQRPASKPVPHRRLVGEIALSYE